MLQKNRFQKFCSCFLGGFLFSLFVYPKSVANTSFLNPKADQRQIMLLNLILTSATQRQIWILTGATQGRSKADERQIMLLNWILTGTTRTQIKGRSCLITGFSQAQPAGRSKADHAFKLDSHKRNPKADRRQITVQNWILERKSKADQRQIMLHN